MEGVSLQKKKHILEFLRQEKIGILSTVRENGFPDAAPIYYYLDAHGNIFFLSRDASRKMINMQHQQHVVLTVLRAATKEVVQVRGVTEIITSKAPDVVDNIIRVRTILEKEEQGDVVMPLLKHTEGTITVVQLRPIELRWRRYSTNGLEEERVSA